MSVFFNDNEPFVLPWLQNLYPEAVVDGRSIVDVRPDEVSNYDRAHFFAGIGGWQYALDLAGWPDDVPVWTGSCPCQPFSTAGRRKGNEDERHLWPELLRLIDQCRPPVVFGEQVASNLGREWLSGVRADLEALGYAVGAADLCAAGAGAPHIRQRLYWVAYTERDTREPRRLADRPGGSAATEGSRPHDEPRRCSDARGLANSSGLRFAGGTEASTVQGNSPERARQHSQSGQAGELPSRPKGHCGTSGVDDTERSRLEGHTGHGDRGHEPGRLDTLTTRPATTASGFWNQCDLLYCTDGKARRIEPGTFPLAHGVPARVGRIRAYGGAIVPQVAATFVKAFMDSVNCHNQTWVR